MEVYETLTQDVDGKGSKISIFKLHEWNKGYALVAFDLTPDMDTDDNRLLIKNDILSLKIEFKQALL